MHVAVRAAASITVKTQGTNVDAGVPEHGGGEEGVVEGTSEGGGDVEVSFEFEGDFVGCGVEGEGVGSVCEDSSSRQTTVLIFFAHLSL